RGVFETVLVEDGQAADLDAHLARLDASVRSVYGTTVRAGLEDAVRLRAAGLEGRHRLRLDAVPGAGDVRVSMTAAELDSADPVWSLVPLVVPGGLGEHKWVDRDRLLGRRGEPLVLDSDGSVLETARANVF